MKLLIQGILLFILGIYGVNASENTTIDVTQTLKLDRAFENTKYILTPGKKARKIFQENIDKINAECCDEDFKQKAKVEEIKNILQSCLDKNCEKYALPIFNSKKPPQKLIAFRLISEIDNLILENENFKYKKLTLQFDANRSEKLKNEENLDILKKSIKELENENSKLKKTVDKMLKNYQGKISKLEKTNNELQDDFQKAFEMLSKNKQKKFKK